MSFTSALDLLRANIEHKIADLDISGQIDLSRLNHVQYSHLVDFLTRMFCKEVNYDLFDPVLLRALVKLAEERIK